MLSSEVIRQLFHKFLGLTADVTDTTNLNVDVTYTNATSDITADITGGIVAGIAEYVEVLLNRKL